MRNVSDKSRRENQNARFVFNNFILKIVPFMRYVEKYGGVGQATDGNIIWRVNIVCWIPKSINTYTLRICNTYCSSTATIIVRTRLTVTLYAHCQHF